MEFQILIMKLVRVLNKCHFGDSASYADGMVGEQHTNENNIPMRSICFTLLLVFIGMLFSQCQKEIEVELPDYERKIVIEGSIECGEPAMVMVTRSVPYFSTMSFETLKNDVLITDAEVTVTDDSTGQTEQLTFVFFDPEFPMCMGYKGRTLLGEPGKSYTLTVRYNGTEYTSTSSMQEPIRLDSAWLAFINPTDTTPTSRIQLTDRAASHDYYMFRIKVHGKKLHDRLWVTSLPVAFDDATFNGLTVNYEILRANPSALFMPEMTDEEKEEYYRITYRKGDTVYIKTSLIDYDAFQYWSAMSYELAVGQNPFMSPAPVPCNISGENVIGNWTAFASTVDTLYYRE